FTATIYLLSILLSLSSPPRRSPPFPYTTLFRSAGPRSTRPIHECRARLEREVRRCWGGSRRRPWWRRPWPPPPRSSPRTTPASRSEEHTSELQSLTNLVCRLLLAKNKRHPQPTP